MVHNWIVHEFSLVELLVVVISIVGGLFSFILESDLSCSSGVKENILHNMPSLRYVKGRGAYIYLTCGLFQYFVVPSIAHINIGLFANLVGCYMVHNARVAERQLAHLKQSISDEKAIISAFQKNDANGDGILEQFEFEGLMHTLGVELDADELDIAFEGIDANGDKKIVFDEFRVWWRESTAEFGEAVAAIESAEMV